MKWVTKDASLRTVDLVLPHPVSFSASYLPQSKQFCSAMPSDCHDGLSHCDMPNSNSAI
jgi:hypothetical protein